VTGATTRVVRAAARAIYRAALAVHAGARAGDAPVMRATFDALLAEAAGRGPAAVARLLAAEVAGLIRHREAIPLVPVSPSPSRRHPMQTTLQDVRFAWRTFRRRPAATLALVATLALGIGANTAIFSVTNAVLLQRLPFPDADRLVMVWEDGSAFGFPRNTPAPGNYADWTTSIPAFGAVGALSRADFTLAGDGDPEKIGGALVTTSLLDALGVPAALGRLWRPDEAVPGNSVAVITHGLWLRRFGADAGIVGRVVTFNGSPFTILGVMPPRFEIADPDLEIFAPLVLSTAQLQNRGSHYLQVIARLAQGATLDQANVQLRGLAERLAREFPQTNRQVGMFAVGLLDDYVGQTRTALLALIGAVGCVLLITCTNVAILLLAQSAGRASELAVRAALGADRRRLLRQLLTESLLLAALAGVIGTALATLAFPLLGQMIPRALSGLASVALDLRVLAVTAGLSALTAGLFGIVPAWRASRVGTAAGARVATRGVIDGGNRLRSALVIGEIALATVLLIGAGLFVASLRSVQAVDLGFRPAGVLTMRLELPRRAYADPVRRTQFVDAVLARVRALPGVESAGFAGAVPLVWKGGTAGFMPEGLPLDPSRPYDANNRIVSPGYMETMGLTLVSGRFFDARDHADGVPVAIINETMARQYWAGQEAMGRRFRLNPDAPWRTIVGLVRDTRVMGIEQPTRPEMYFPIAQSADNWMRPRDLAVRVSGDPLALVPSLSRAVWSVDPAQPVSDIATMTQLVADEMQHRTTQTTLMSLFAGLALLLQAIGIYGVLSQHVAERTPEIGLRLALGGNPQRIRARVVRHGVGLGIAGLAIGLVAAWWGSALLGDLLFGVAPRDARLFGLQAAVLLVVCVLATWLPARRASRVDPISALRAE
jgi:putative ABC transport system permease protein